VTGTAYQVYVAAIMAYRQSLRELGLLLAFVVVFPLGFLFFLGLIVKTALLTQVLVGSLMMEMALLNINVLAQSIGQDKQSKIYELWVSLPMNPVVYVTAQALSLLPFSLLSTAVTLLVGIAYFGLPISAAMLPAIFGGFLLVWSSSLGIGFLIGVYGRTPRQINSVAQIVGIVMSFFAPVFYPVTVLPLALQYVAYLWPLTWGAQLLLGILSGVPGQALEAALVLAGFTGLWLVLIARGLRWREK
jgi:ABC-2 type transport system permease protein